MDDYYEILGLSRNASRDEIKRAYKELARRHHPDKGGDADLFKKINEAYGVLSDENLRSKYDRFGKEGMEGVDMSGFDFFDIFQMHHRPSRRQTRDRVMDLEISLEEAHNGASVKFRFKRKIFTGEASRCNQCDGRGQVVEQMTTNIGIIQNMRLCPACAGVGTNVREDQFQTVAEVINIDIPPRCPSGQQILVEGKSDEMPNMATGNLVLRIVFRPHPSFVLVNGRDLLWTVKIHPVEALTSFSREIVLPSGERLVITHTSGDAFLSTIHKWKVVKEKGMYDPSRVRGDLFIAFELEEFFFKEEDKEMLGRLAGRVFEPIQRGGNKISSLRTTDPIPQREERRRDSHPHHPRGQNVQECRPS